MKNNKFGSISKYMLSLKKQGISGTRIPDIWNALFDLHSAISKLDPSNWKRFWQESVEQRLDAFSQAEKLSVVTPETIASDLIEGDLLDQDRAIASTVHIADIQQTCEIVSDDVAREHLQGVAKKIGEASTDSGVFWSAIESYCESEGLGELYEE